MTQKEYCRKECLDDLEEMVKHSAWNYDWYKNEIKDKGLANCYDIERKVYKDAIRILKSVWFKG